ncbi:MAG: hypothetical protein E6J91_45525 [Deltaproteobacteria bacterium]|nr:MAG: hypothetical protein E6J91_45525 [Deltaproteobacteria bacterium]
MAACAPGADATGPDRDRSHLIELGSQIIDTRLVRPDTAPASTTGDGYVLVKFPGPVTAAQLQALSASAQIYTGLGASWTGVYRPGYKIARGAADLAALAPADTITVMATVFPDADVSRVAAAAAQLPGATVVGADAGQQVSRVRLRVAGADLAAATSALANLAEVFWIDVEGRRQLLNDTTIWVGQSGLNAGMTTPVFDHGIHGEGQVVGYIDTGIDADMCYFRDTARGLPPTNACDGGTTVDLNQRKVIGVDFLTST